MLVLSSPSGSGQDDAVADAADRYPHRAVDLGDDAQPRPGEVEAGTIASSMKGASTPWWRAATLWNGRGVREPLRHAAAPVERALAMGRDVLRHRLASPQQLREKGRDDLVSVFCAAATIPDLEARLRTRAQDADEVIPRPHGQGRQ